MSYTSINVQPEAWLTKGVSSNIVEQSVYKIRNLWW